MGNIISAVARASRREGGSEVWQRIMAGIEAAQFRPDGTPVTVTSDLIDIDMGNAGTASGEAQKLWAAAASAVAGQAEVRLMLDGVQRATITSRTETVHSYLGRLAGELADAGAPAVVIERLARAASAIRAWRDEQVFEVVSDDKP